RRNTMKTIKLVSLATITTAVCLAMSPAVAADYPTRPISLVVPFVAGGAFDVIARLASKHFGDELGGAVVVENKPGAGGTLGGRLVANAKPDGYTLLLSGTGPISIAPAVYKKLGYVPAEVLEPVIQLTSSPFVLVTGEGFKGTTVKEFVAFLKADPDKYNYASTGNGTLVHLAGEYFQQQTITAFLHVPYSGGAPATQSMLANTTLFSITNVPNVLGQIKSGKLKGLATTGPKRSSAFFEIPTMIESGYPEFDLTGWIGIFAPLGTEPGIIQKLNAAFAKVMQAPEIKARLIEQGDEVATGSTKDFTAFVAASNKKWQKIANDAKVEID
ncbi:MAG: tripartite tricarboxylate transporter substrate binding protein, partial [Burkholderiales bacterium]